MTPEEEENRKRVLETLINECNFHYHCNGCDEWCCDMTQDRQEIDEENLNRIWNHIRQWMQ